MGGLGMAFAGLLQGAGQGLAMQAQQNAATAASDLEYRRKVALENLRSQNDMARIDKQAETNDWLDSRSTDRKTNAAIVTDKARTQNDVTLENVRAKNQQALAKLNSSLNMDEYEKKAAVDLVSEATRNQQEIGHDEITADGRLILYAKDGKTILRASAPGTFTPPGSGGSGGLGGDVIAQARGGTPARGPAQAPAPAPSEKPKPKPQQPAQGRAPAKPQAKTYTAAEAQAQAKKSGVPVEQVHRVMRQAGYKLTTE